MGLKDLKEHLIPTLPWAMQVVQDEIFRDLGVWRIFRRALVLMLFYSSLYEFEILANISVFSTLLSPEHYLMTSCSSNFLVDSLFPLKTTQ